MNLSTFSNITDITDRHNALSGKNADPKSLAKRGKTKLLEQIAAMEANLPPAEAPKPAVSAEDQAKAREIVALHGTMDSTILAKIEEAQSTPNGLDMLLKQMKPVEAPKVKAKKTKEKKEKGPVIRHVAEALLLEVTHRDEDNRPYGHSYEYILDAIKAQFEGAKTSAACLRWYAVHMRERGEKVPNRPRAPAKAKEA